MDPEFAAVFTLDEDEPGVPRRPGDKFPRSARRLAWSGKINGWDTSFALEPTENRLDVDLSFSRSVGGTRVVSLVGDGWIASFRQRTRLEFEDGQLKNAEAWTEEIRGEMEITWAAANRGDFIGTDLNLLTIPVGFPFTVPVGPIPVTIWLKASGRLTAQLHLANMSSRGSMKIVYGGNQGFRIEDTSFSPQGGPNSTEFSLTGDTVSAGAVTVGFGARIEFPHIELSILGTTSVLVSIDTAVEGFFEPGLFSGDQPCQWGKLVLRGTAGYELSLLGRPLLSSSEELWRREFPRYAGGVPCN